MKRGRLSVSVTTNELPEDIHLGSVIVKSRGLPDRLEFAVPKRFLPALKKVLAEQDKKVSLRFSIKF